MTSEGNSSFDQILLLGSMYSIVIIIIIISSSMCLYDINQKETILSGRSVILIVSHLLIV